MPELSRFLGIVVKMFREVEVRHHRPHFHAYYQGKKSTYALEPLELIRGNLPRRQRRFVEEWATIHYNELVAAWQQMQSGELPNRIEPL